ncbi:MAG: hypothetical protein ACLPHP_14425, partial [Candidatus Sulfotelmatobacter sp.]
MVNPAVSPIMVLAMPSDVYDIPTRYVEASTAIALRTETNRRWRKWRNGAEFLWRMDRNFSYTMPCFG